MDNSWPDQLGVTLSIEEDKTSEDIMDDRREKRKRDSWQVMTDFSELGPAEDVISDVEEDSITISHKKMRYDVKPPYETSSESELEEEVLAPLALQLEPSVKHSVQRMKENQLLSICGAITSNVREACQNDTLIQLLRQSGLHQDLSDLLQRVQAVCDFQSFTQNHAVAPFSLSMGNFYAVPRELLHHLFTFLQPKEICAMRAVCHEFHSIGARETLWQGLCEREGFEVPNKLLEKYGKGWEFIFKSKAVNLWNVAAPKDRTLVGFIQRNDKQIRCEGEWKNGRLHGYGIEKSLVNGSTREGEWVDGMMNGYGIWTRKDKGGEDIYQGMWVDDKREGPGVMVYNHGRRYEGEWVKGKRHGKGKTFNNGRVYTGELQDGKIHGFGEMKYTDGRRYVGQWVRASRQGNGVMIYADGRVYTGEWSRGKRHGNGKLVYTDGSFYTGDWQKNHRQGKGSMVYATGKAMYEGEWLKSTMHGKGTLIFPDGGIYQGDWANGQMDGYGTMFYVNGAVYEGSWKANQRHGRGVMMYPNGGIFEGEFKMGLEMRKSMWN